VAAARQLGESALQRIGYDAGEAAIITDQLIDNALCGYRFASLPRILTIADDARTQRQRQPVRVVRETPVSALVDGGNNVGYIAAFRGAEMAVAKAQASGIAIVGVHNSYYSGRNAYFVEHIVRAGWSASTLPARGRTCCPRERARRRWAPTRSASGFLRRRTGDLHIGTASVMWGEVLLMAGWSGTAGGTGFDADGNPTRDAAAAAQVASHRSAATKAMGCRSQSRRSAFCGRSVGERRRADYGFLFIAIDPDIMLGPGAFATQMAELVARIKATPRQDGWTKSASRRNVRSRARTPPGRRDRARSQGGRGAS